jgi:hypothetical protein
MSPFRYQLGRLAWVNTWDCSTRNFFWRSDEWHYLGLGFWWRER